MSSPSGLVAQAGEPQVRIQTATYATVPTAAGDIDLEMDLYSVPGQRLRGAVILMHGGGFTGGDRGLEENRAYGNALARRGYLAAAISYRLHSDEPRVDGWAAAYADMVRSHPDPRIVGAIRQLGGGFADAAAAAAVDLVTAVAWLRANSDRLGFEPANIAIFGASAGAITALTTTHAMQEYGAENLEVAAVIDLRGFLVRGEGAPNPFGRDGPPLMLLHGEADDRVPLADAEAVYRLAVEARVPVEFYTAAGVGHELGGSSLLELRVAENETVLERIDSFIRAAFAGMRPEGPVRQRLLPAAPPAPEAKGPAASHAGSFREELTRAVATLLDSVAADDGFVASLYDVEKTELLQYDLLADDRLDWSYWPRRRAGLSLGHMTAAQRKQVQTILEVLLSSKGYLQVNHVMMLEDFLADTETRGFLRGDEHYSIAVFGQPADRGVWGLRFEGHHISLNVTVSADTVFVTPSFLGASPAPVPSGARAGFNPLRYEQRYAYELLASLTLQQRDLAVLGEHAPAEILATQFQVESTEWRNWQERLARDGVSSASFDDGQMDLLHQLMREIVGLYRPEIGLAWLENLDMSTLMFAWLGSVEPGNPHYYRIQGDSFVFELDAAQENGAHIHTVWRDRRHDLGGDLLGEHYRKRAH